MSTVAERAPRHRRTLRVLMTVDAVGGVWQYGLDLAGHLRRYGVETVLAVLGPAPSTDAVAAAMTAGVHTLVPTGLSLDWTAETPQAVATAGKTVAGLAAEVRADLIHLNSPALAAGGTMPAPVLAVCHSCVATWWQAVRSGPMPTEFVWRTDLVRQGYEAANALAAPTAAFAAATARAYGLAQPPTVVRNGRQRVRRAPPPQGTPRDFVFTAGRLWDEGKNLATLDRAAEHLSVPVVAAGPLEGPNGTRTSLRRIQPLGRLADEAIAGYLAAGPIFVSAARYEPFGLAVLEAAQAGCALVLADIPSFRELWDGAAAFAPADDDHAIAATTESILRDPAHRAALGAAARERAGAYTVEAMTAGILGVYRSILPEGYAEKSVGDAAA